MDLQDGSELSEVAALADMMAAMPPRRLSTLCRPGTATPMAR